MIELVEEKLDNLVAVKITDTIDRKDYNKLIPRMESKIKQCGKINIFLEITDGVEPAVKSLGQDMHFNLKHAQDIRKVAFVGNEEHEEEIVNLFKPLENAEIRWYNPVDRQEALEWLRS